MAFDCHNHQRKPLLFSDLFKTPRNTAPESKLEGSSCSSSSTQFLTSCDSSSSGFSTPLYSDLGSSEDEDSDFIAELTRQMAECMLQEDEEDENANVEDNVSVASSEAKSTTDVNYAHSAAINDLPAGFYLGTDQIHPNIQVYQVKNQPPVHKEVSLSRGRRLKKTESAQKKRIQKTEQQLMQSRARSGYSGPGMHAIFLGGGSGPRVGPPGTGVFLPRHQTELKRKSGCSTVLIPTRVLQVLEHHFSRFQDSAAPPLLRGGSPNAKDEPTLSNGLRNKRSELESGPAELEFRASDGDDMHLPQEWTY